MSSMDVLAKKKYAMFVRGRHSTLRPTVCWTMLVYLQTALDLMSSYYQLRIEAADQEKKAFNTRLPDLCRWRGGRSQVAQIVIEALRLNIPHEIIGRITREDEPTFAMVKKALIKQYKYKCGEKPSVYMVQTTVKHQNGRSATKQIFAPAQTFQLTFCIMSSNMRLLLCIYHA